MNHTLHSRLMALMAVSSLGQLTVMAQGNSTTAPTKSPSAVRVMQMNVWNEATTITDGFNKIVDVIAASNADAVAISEVRNSNGDFHNRLVTALAAKGLTFYGTYIGGDMGLISRYPITGYELVYPLTNDHGSLGVWQLQTPEGRTISIASAHMDWMNYAVYGPRGYDGNTWQMIDKNKDGIPDPITRLSTLNNMDKASMRDECVAAFVNYATSLPADAPIILLGDFNECSHLDWTDAMKNLYSHNGVVNEWANSKTLATAGFSDSWRELYSNPVTHPGATWPSEAFGKGTTSWAHKADERDRIDFVYYKKNNTLQASQARIVGSPKHYVYDVLTTDTTQTPYCLTSTPWPSDHKALMVDLEVLPSSRVVPTVAFTTASQASVDESGTMTVTAKLSSITTQAVSIPFSISGTATNGSDYTISASPITIPAGSTTGTATITITPDTLAESNETVILTIGNPTNAIKGLTKVHTATITNGNAATNPSVTPSKATYDLNESISINYQNAPGNAKDWIGLYNPGTTPGTGNPSLTWQYINGSLSGTATFTGMATAGSYVAYLFLNDGYTILAQCTFNVQAGGAPAAQTMSTTTTSNQSLSSTTTLTQQAAGTNQGNNSAQFNAWRNNHFTQREMTNGNAEPTSDSDGDGIPNLMEYALNTDPKKHNSGITIKNDHSGIHFTVTRPKGGRQDINYIAEYSDDMITWKQALLETSIEGDPETLTARPPVTSGKSTHRFLRLRVEQK